MGHFGKTQQSGPLPSRAYTYTQSEWNNAGEIGLLHSRVPYTRNRTSWTWCTYTRRNATGFNFSSSSLSRPTMRVLSPSSSSWLLRIAILTWYGCRICIPNAGFGIGHRWIRKSIIRKSIVNHFTELPGCLIHCITPVAKQEQNVRPPWSVFCQCKIHTAMYQQRRCCENTLPWNTRAPINWICNNQCTIRKSIIDRWEQIIWIPYYCIIARVTSQILENLHLLTSLQHSELAFGGSFSGVVTTGRRHPVRKDKWEVKVL